MLAAVPGLDRQFVYYLEAQGHIKPTKLPRKRIAHRDYSADDLRVVQDVWRYYQHGFSLQSANELSRRVQDSLVYVGLLVAPREWDAFFEAAKGIDVIRELSVVHGGPFDFLLALDVPDEAFVYHDLFPRVSMVGVAGPPLIFKSSRFFRKTAGSAGGKAPMIAYVFLKVPAKNVESVLRDLEEIEAVQEAAVVYGETDIIAKVIAPDQEALDALVVDRLHGMELVESTRTFIVIERLHWQRPVAASGSIKLPNNSRERKARNVRNNSGAVGGSAAARTVGAPL